MKTCTHCGLCFDDCNTYCASCGAPLPMASPSPVPARKPSTLIRSIVGLVLSASGLECAAACALITGYFSFLSTLFGGIGLLAEGAEGMDFASGFLAGYSLVFTMILGGIALALALVGRRLAAQCAALGNTSRILSITNIFSRVAVIVTIVSAALATLRFIIFLFAVI